MGVNVIDGGSTDSFDFGGFGVDWKVDGNLSAGRFSIVHHLMAPRALAAPLRFHHDGDGFSFVLKGTMGALPGDEVVEAGPGTWVVEPRRQWHTFWNAGDAPCEIIEVISHAGIENDFREVAASRGDLERFAAVNRAYSLDVDFEGRSGLCECFGLTFPEP